MEIPRGDLVHSRVVDGPGEALRTVLSRGLTGYLVLEPSDRLLLADGVQGVITVEDGVPVVAYAGDGAGGDAALASLSTPGPCRADCYSLAPDTLSDVHSTQALRVAPGAPARELADDPELAERTRERAPEGRHREESHDAVAAFLADDERIAAIREDARSEARARAPEWGLEDQLVDRPGESSDAGADAEAVRGEDGGSGGWSRSESGD